MAFSCDVASGKKRKPPVRSVESRRMAVTKMLAQRFALTSEGCWLWQGPIAENGYGFLVCEIRRRQFRKYKIHRLSFEHFKRQVMPTWCVRHTCHVRHCYNPAHLVEGTKKENSQDMIRAGRAPWQEKPPEKPCVIVGYDFPPNPPVKPTSSLASVVMENEMHRRVRKSRAANLPRRDVEG